METDEKKVNKIIHPIQKKLILKLKTFLQWIPSTIKKIKVQSLKIKNFHYNLKVKYKAIKNIKIKIK
jgi:hypothetical protein